MKTPSVKSLSVPALLSHAFATLRGNAAFAFHISWPWMLFIIPLGLWMELTAPDMPPPGPDMPSPDHLRLIFTDLAVGLLALVGTSAIAVNWHRYILRGETPHGAQLLRLDGVVWRYFGNSLLVGLLVMLALVPLAFITALFAGASGGLSGGLMTLYFVAAAIVALPLLFRLYVKLPAVALEVPGASFKAALAATRGNNLQLFMLGAILLGGVFGASSLVQSAVLAGGKNLAVTLIGFAVLQAMQWVVTLLFTTVLTSLYGFFVENRQL